MFSFEAVMNVKFCKTPDVAVDNVIMFENLEKKNYFMTGKYFCQTSTIQAVSNLRNIRLTNRTSHQWQCVFRPTFEFRLRIRPLLLL